MYPWMYLSPNVGDTSGLTTYDIQNEAVQVVKSLYPRVHKLCNDIFAELRVPNLSLISMG